jgi:hypothetical protein
MRFTPLNQFHFSTGPNAGRLAGIFIVAGKSMRKTRSSTLK